MGFSEVQLTKETLEEEDKGRSAARSDEVVRTWGGRSPPEQDNSGGLSSRGGTGRQRERTVLDEESLEVLCSRREAQRRRGCKRRVQPVIIVQELGGRRAEVPWEKLKKKKWQQRRPSQSSAGATVELEISWNAVLWIVSFGSKKYVVNSISLHYLAYLIHSDT